MPMDFLLLIAFTLGGTALGIFTGLTPGIHTNNIALFALTLYFIGVDAVYLASMVVAAMISHTFLDFIPSTFLGAPEEDTSLSVLPMHRLLLRGEGYRAVYLSAIGSILAVAFSLPVIPLLQIFFSIFTYDDIKPYIPVVLIAIILYMLYLESRKSIKKMLIASYVFLLSGIFGIIIFNLPQNYNFVPVDISAGLLFPLFTGLFGMPILLLSQKTVIPKQRIEDVKVGKDDYKASFFGSLSGSLVGFLPGVTSGIAGVISRVFYKEEMNEKFIVSLGSVNTANAIFNLAALFIILHPRSGALNVISQIINVQPWISLYYVPDLFILLLISAAISSFLSFFITLKMGEIFAKYVHKLQNRYGDLSKGIIIFLAVLMFLFCGWVGLVVACAATLIGLLPPKNGVMRVHLMGVLIIPVLLFYLGI